jgi:hypothetical protein
MPANDGERILIVALCIVAVLNLVVALWWKREAERLRNLAIRGDAAPNDGIQPPGQTALFPELRNNTLEARTSRVVRKLLRWR